MSWIIFNKTNPELCWNETEGWQRDNYDTFTDGEREELTLPTDGEWEQVAWSKEVES